MSRLKPGTLHSRTVALETGLRREAVTNTVYGSAWAVRNRSSPFRFPSTPSSVKTQDEGGGSRWLDVHGEGRKASEKAGSRPSRESSTESDWRSLEDKDERWVPDGTGPRRRLERPERLKKLHPDTPANRLRQEDRVNQEEAGPPMIGSPMFVMSLEPSSPFPSRPNSMAASTPVRETPEPSPAGAAKRRTPSDLWGSPDEEPRRPFTSLGFIDGPSKFEDILPNSSGRKGGRAASVLWQQKRYLGIGYGAVHSKNPASGLRTSELVETEAAQVFGTGNDLANMQGMGKFVEARALEMRLADVIANGNRILEKPPLSQARRQYYGYTIPAVFAIFAAVIDAVGPFGTILSQLREQVHALVYSDELDHSDETPRKIPNVEFVAQLKRDKENIFATLNSASMLTAKSDKDIARLNNENKECEQRILQLERQLQAEKRVYGDLQEKLNAQTVSTQKPRTDICCNKAVFGLLQHEEYDRLMSNFKDLQKGFLLGQLQDEMKEMLLEGVGDEDAQGAAQETSVLEEQSAMQRLVQQLRDARESMLTAKDDMNYWKAKYEGVEHRMRTITESFHDTTNSLELTKEKMLHMVPSAVHVALKERYQKVLDELARLTHTVTKDKKKNRQPHKTKERQHDNWRHYNFEEDSLLDTELDGGEFTKRDFRRTETGSSMPINVFNRTPTVGSGAEETSEEEEEEEEHNELDDPDNNVPTEFVDSVAEQRERLNRSYRSFRNLHGSAVVSWTQLRTMSLAEFARLEEDCFAKNSIWALALLKEEKSEFKQQEKGGKK